MHPRLHSVQPYPGKDRINRTKICIDNKYVDANTITDTANYIKYGSTIRFIFYYNKIWANKHLGHDATKIYIRIGT